VLRMKGTDSLAKHTRFILQSMRFVNDQILPRKLLQHLAFGIAYFVRGDTDIPRPGRTGIVISPFSRILDATFRATTIVCGCFIGKVLLLHGLAFILGAMESNDSQRRTPSGQFVHPIGQCRFRDTYQVGALNFHKLVLVGHDGDGLKRLTETCRCLDKE
jgi:hypothetical protein